MSNSSDKNEAETEVEKTIRVMNERHALRDLRKEHAALLVKDLECVFEKHAETSVLSANDMATVALNVLLKGTQQQAFCFNEYEKKMRAAAFLASVVFEVEGKKQAQMVSALLAKV